MLVYLPGFLPQMEPRITRVMPAILENLEYANLVIARNTDLKFIFGADTAKKLFRDHIERFRKHILTL